MAKFVIASSTEDQTQLSRILHGYHRITQTHLVRQFYDFFFEMNIYDEMTDGSGEIYIESQPYGQTVRDKLVRFGSKEYWNAAVCRRKPVIQLRKTDICPFVKLKINEIPMIFVEGTLILNGPYLRITLSKFEHKLQNDTVYMCLEDYMLYYYAALHKTSQSCAVPDRSMTFIVIYTVSYIASALY